MIPKNNKLLEIALIMNRCHRDMVNLFPFSRKLNLKKTKCEINSTNVVFSKHLRIVK